MSGFYFVATTRHIRIWEQENYIFLYTEATCHTSLNEVIRILHHYFDNILERSEETVYRFCCNIHSIFLPKSAPPIVLFKLFRVITFLFLFQYFIFIKKYIKKKNN